MIELTIYVPALDSPYRHTIKAGSGIVGTFVPELGTRIKIDYEGNLHHASNITTWEDKVFHAAGRHVKNYPTVARAWVEAKDLIEVGVFRCTDDWKHTEWKITNAEALLQWQTP